MGQPTECVFRYVDPSHLTWNPVRLKTDPFCNKDENANRYAVRNKGVRYREKHGDK